MSTLNPNNFSAANVAPFVFEDPERHELAMSEALHTQVFQGDDGQVFSGLDLNRSKSDAAPIVYLGSWLSAATTQQQKYTAYQYAAANPEHRVLTVDLPSHGVSDRMPLKQKMELIESRGVSRIAKSQAEAVAERVEGAESIIVSGDSVGGRVALDFVTAIGELGIRPVLLTGFDISGLDAVSTARMLAKLSLKKGDNRHSRYHAGTDNEKLDNSYSIFKSELDELDYDEERYSPWAVYKRDPLLAAILMARSPAGSSDGFDALRSALDRNTHMSAEIVSGGLSRVCRWIKVERKVAELSVIHNERFNWHVWPNDSHSMGIAEHQPRMAAFVKAAIDLHVY